MFYLFSMDLTSPGHCRHLDVQLSKQPIKPDITVLSSSLRRDDLSP